KTSRRSLTRSSGMPGRRTASPSRRNRCSPSCCGSSSTSTARAPTRAGRATEGSKLVELAEHAVRPERVTSPRPGASMMWEVALVRGLLLVTSIALACVAVAGAGGSDDLDPTFGSGGVVVTDLGRDDWITDVAVQPDGKIVAAGWTMPTPAQDAFALVRYLPDGRLDPAFGDGGKVVHEDRLVSGLAVQRNGAIVVAGVGPGRS